jgi:mono/diheme cytochrome c family protein
MFARIQLMAARLGVAAAALALLAAPVEAQRKPGGAEVWGANCGRCHRIRAVDAYDARQWESVVSHMALVARLTSDETQAVREFLVGAARARQGGGGAAAARAERAPLLVASLAREFPRGAACCDLGTGRSLFEVQCVACHGREGKGNGPAAAAMNPRPANLTNAPRMARLPDDSLVQVVTQGRKGMPGYQKLLSPEQIRELVFYVRSLKP